MSQNVGMSQRVMMSRPVVMSGQMAYVTVDWDVTGLQQKMNGFKGKKCVRNVIQPFSNGYITL